MAIAVVDYKKGNLLSVARWIQAAGYEAFISSDPSEIRSADAMILPGVGSFKDASDTLVESGCMQAMRDSILRGVPLLGICLGAQLLVGWGDEGCDAGKRAEGIGCMEGRCVRMEERCSDGSRVKIPHVGWNSLDFDGASPCELFGGIENGSYFYFTHSYMLVPKDTDLVCAYATHAQRFTAAVACGNVFGLQFHPEKSSELGLVVGRNFGRIVYGR